MFCRIFGANESQPFTTWAKHGIVMTPFCSTIFICQQDPKWQFLPHHGCCCSQSLQGRDKYKNFIIYSTHGRKHKKVFFMTQRVLEIGCPENVNLKHTPIKPHEHSLQQTTFLIKEINSGVILTYVGLQGPHLRV